MKTNLPVLPRQIKKREANFGIAFRKWITSKPLPSGAYELKQTKIDSFLFSALEDHQIAYLLRIKGSKGELIRVMGLQGEPDYVYLRRSSAWVVIKYPRSFHIIDIEVFLAEKERSKRRSLTSTRAAELSTWSQ